MPVLGPEWYYEPSVLARYCPSCGARPDALCTTTGGNPCRPHNPRRRDVPRPRAKPKLGPSQMTRRAVARRSGGWCEVCPLIDPGAPRHAADELHHQLPRSLGGEDSSDNLLHTCRRGHRLVHDNPDRAYEHGLLLRAGGKVR